MVPSNGIGGVLFCRRKFPQYAHGSELICALLQWLKFEAAFAPSLPSLVQGNGLFVPSLPCSDGLMVSRIELFFSSTAAIFLIYKLEFYGIAGKLLIWIRGFLTDRSHRVVIDHCFSPNCSVKSGVPQGSVLGPLLFILYINDIDSVCCGHTKLQLFADDAKLYCNINIENDSISLQQSLDRLVNWANMWQLSININKCAVLSLSVKHQPILRDYFIDGISILHKDSYVDLGITIANSLSFEAHINGIVCKARQRVSTLFRGFITRNRSIMRQAFISYVRPILEYNSIIWNPTYKYLIDAIEQVQHNFTKRIPAIMSLPYPERLAILNLELLELRRLRFDLIYYYKVLHNLTPINPDDVFNTYTPDERCRLNLPYLQKPAKASNRYLSTLFFRNVDAWNTLPIALQQSPSLPAFKRGIKNVDLSQFLKSN
jgi:ribonuclease P/MRP protein subunit RPP40